MQDNIVEAKKIYFEYPDGQCAINNVSFTVNRGESVGIVGTNGAGKSTLMLLILGILFPSIGEISISNIKVTKKTLSEIRERIGMVFQNPDDQLFMPTVYDDVAFGPRNYKYSEAEISKRVLSALETVGIAHLKDRAPYRLSGGEKRCATIASVLSMNLDVLMMDEPTSALNPKSRRRLINLLKNFEYTKIIATHDLDMILELCERTIILRQGKIIADGITSEILINQELMESCDLELPLSIQNCLRCKSHLKNINSSTE